MANAFIPGAAAIRGPATSEYRHSMDRNSSIIRIMGAREHNLKSVSIDLPRERLVVFCGVSGSGKSSLAFDTIFAEGRRRYVESLSPFARYMLGEMARPAVDHIEGLSPAIAIDHMSSMANPRSTVATATDIYDFLRVLYARVGQPHCPECGTPVQAMTVQNIVDTLMALDEGTRIQVLAPVEAEDDDWHGVLRDARRAGFARIRVDGVVHELAEKITVEPPPEAMQIVVDRLAIKDGIASRLTDSVETALTHGDDVVMVDVVDGDELVFSTRYACPTCDNTVRTLSPAMFSFNSPHGTCPTCKGIGVVKQVDPSLLVSDPGKSISEGALRPYGELDPEDESQVLHSLAHHYDFDLRTPWRKLEQRIRDIILHGSGDENVEFAHRRANGGSTTYSEPFEGLVGIIQGRYDKSNFGSRRSYYESFVGDVVCPECKGYRLNRDALAVRVAGVAISDVVAMTVERAVEFFASLSLSGTDSVVAAELVRQINQRLTFLIKVGVGYLTLERGAPTLSRGEAQRIRLATQIGSRLAGVMYILDEPSAGLHQRDHTELLETLFELRDIGNSVIVVEHDAETIRQADHVVEFGPGAGVAGGEVIYQGDLEGMLNDKRSLTGAYLSGRRSIVTPPLRREATRGSIRILGAAEHNLRDVDVEIPLGMFVCVTGVSGSGKSTLVHDILYRALRRDLHRSKDRPGAHRAIEGLDGVDKVIHIDQRPIGRTPRSNAATYTELFDIIRELMAQTPDAQLRGYGPSRFSFNTGSGRCPVCDGKGTLQVEMDFLPDVHVTCEECGGKRYNRETLQVYYKGKTIADMLDLTVAEARDLFANHYKAGRILDTLCDVGLDYIRLGQPATTLSAGEAQRVKLSRELARPGNDSTLYILDEPTTGLHFADIDKLLDIINRLVDAGHTAVVIEHNLDVIKTADWVIDIGPEGGDRGGEVVAVGTPEQVALVAKSHTGRFLQSVLGGS